MKRGFQASAGATALPVEDESIAGTTSVLDRSMTESLPPPTDESPMRSPSESSRSSASRTPSSRSSHSPVRSSQSNAASPTRASYGPSTVTRYREWPDSHTDSDSRALVQPQATTLGRNASKKRSLQGEPKASAKRQRTQRMTEQFFQHSRDLLYRAKLESDTRAGELEDELRRQQQKREKYESKIRTLRRELEVLDPEAAKAYDRGELSAAAGATGALASETSSSLGTANDALLPPAFVQAKASLRTSIQERRALFTSFRSLLNQSSSA